MCTFRKIIETLCRFPIKEVNTQIKHSLQLIIILYIYNIFVDETISPAEFVSNLTMNGSTVDSVTYSCSATNRAGTSEKKTCQVTVIRKGCVCIIML